MPLDLQTAVLPLRRDTGGVIRIGRTRVTLESMVHAYLEGESAEGIVERFPTLELADVHAVLGWFLKNREEVEAYLRVSRAEEASWRAESRRRSPVAGLRKGLRARRPG